MQGVLLSNGAGIRPPVSDHFRCSPASSPVTSPHSSPGPRGQEVRRCIQVGVISVAAGHAVEPVPCLPRSDPVTCRLPGLVRRRRQAPLSPGLCPRGWCKQGLWLLTIGPGGASSTNASGTPGDASGKSGTAHNPPGSSGKIPAGNAGGLPPGRSRVLPNSACQFSRAHSCRLSPCIATVLTAATSCGLNMSTGLPGSPGGLTVVATTGSWCSWTCGTTSD